MTGHSPTLLHSNFSWLNEPGLQAIFLAIHQGGGEARVVGGAVRDTLLNKKVKDIDLASTLPPQAAIHCLNAAGLKTIPTGLEHGTITAVSAGKGYEITTLRSDIATNGRHATKILFTNDWQKDAMRRDFTLNALYLDQKGTLYDYFNGKADLAARHVRFIGNADDRIKEDYLRILRFFRFCAQLDSAALDPEALHACRTHAPSLAQLSAERIWAEFRKTLSAPHPARAIQAMQSCGILSLLLQNLGQSPESEPELETEVKLETELEPELDPKFKRSQQLEQSPEHKPEQKLELEQELKLDTELIPEQISHCLLTLERLEAQFALAPAWARRLALLISNTPKNAPPPAASLLALTQKFKMSRTEKTQLSQICAAINPALLTLPARNFRKNLYQHGPDILQESLVVTAALHLQRKTHSAAFTCATAPQNHITSPAIASTTASPFSHNLAEKMSLISNWSFPLFPLKGADLQKLGFSQGKVLGDVLKNIETQWIESDFKLTRTECLALAHSEKDRL